MRTSVTSRHCRFEDLVDSFNQELDPAQAETVDRHLEHCARCRHQLSQVKNTLDVAEAASNVEHNSLYATRFPDLVLQGIRKRQCPQRSPRLLAVASSIVVLAVWGAAAGFFAPVQPQHSSQEPTALSDRSTEAANFDDDIRDYCIETATTDELLQEVGTLDRDRVATLLEGI